MDYNELTSSSGCMDNNTCDVDACVVWMRCVCIDYNTERACTRSQTGGARGVYSEVQCAHRGDAQRKGHAPAEARASLSDRSLVSHLFGRLISQSIRPFIRQCIRQLIHSLVSWRTQQLSAGEVGRGGVGSTIAT